MEDNDQTKKSIQVNKTSAVEAVAHTSRRHLSQEDESKFVLLGFCLEFEPGMVSHRWVFLFWLCACKRQRVEVEVKVTNE